MHFGHVIFVVAKDSRISRTRTAGGANEVHRLRPTAPFHRGKAKLWRRDAQKMLRRKPTRLELKIDDIEEFESVKKELEARRRQSEETESGASVITVDVIQPGTSTSAVSKTELVNERIGYKPQPKPSTLPTLFGSLQF
ncbi:anaphase-promoting complex subunit CDC26-like isoform 1-T1 [Synchiropus picturatus]